MPALRELARPATRVGAIPLYLLAALAFVVTAVLRYNVPEGAYGGLTDDHFYFVTQGWQMLFGELPDRDYFEPGAPLMLAISAALQTLLGRSIWSEYVFCVTAVAAGSALTFVLAARASGSVILGVLAFLLQFALLPRLYGYPKIVVYAAAIAAMWSWASSPRVAKTCAIAAITVVGFLLRHDHGIYVAGAFALLLMTVEGVRLAERARHLGVFVAAVAVGLAPYLVYLQRNGGIERHFVTTYAWSARDYIRSPRVLPELDPRSIFDDSDADAPASEWWEHAPFLVLAEDATFWLFWLFNLLPALALLMLVVRPATGPPGWTQERAKVLIVIALAFVLDYRLLRGNLAGRLADVSVPLAILSAWMLGMVVQLVRSGRVDVVGRVYPVGIVPRTIVVSLAVVIVTITGLVLTRPFRKALEDARALEGIEAMRGGIEVVTDRLQHTWPLDAWTNPSRSDFALAKYIQTCTSPRDRVLITEFKPQILGLAQRGFAAGHVELRSGGFFATPEEQTLTVDRWRQQSVPFVIGPTADDYRDWVEGQAIVARYLEQAYRNLGERDVDGFKFLFFERREATPVRTYAPLSLPCYR